VIAGVIVSVVVAGGAFVLLWRGNGAHEVGECARQDACEVLELEGDYLAYRNAHMRVTSVWLEKSDGS
jgi:hypothetical protein